MKQKLPRVVFIKIENVSVSNTPAQKRRRILPECAFRKRFKKREKPDGAVPPVGFENGRRFWRQRAAAIAGGDPRRGRGIGGFFRAQGVVPHRVVVVVVAGVHRVNVGPCSGGRWFGRG